MVTIRMFIPYLNMKNRFEAAVSRVQGQDDIRIELLHVFGTPESLSCHGDAEILVDRKYILAAMGLLSQHYPTAALEIMKKEIAYYGHKK